MKKAMFRLRNAGLIITNVSEDHSAGSIARRMDTGGFIVAQDSFRGKDREVIINLKDVMYVILEEND